MFLPSLPWVVRHKYGGFSLCLDTQLPYSGWKTTLLTSVFYRLHPLTMHSVPHGTMLTADFADVDAHVDGC
jgi:hypothetical protein